MLGVGCEQIPESLGWGSTLPGLQAALSIRLHFLDSVSSSPLNLASLAALATPALITLGFIQASGAVMPPEASPSPLAESLSLVGWWWWTRPCSLSGDLRPLAHVGQGSENRSRVWETRVGWALSDSEETPQAPGGSLAWRGGS